MDFAEPTWVQVLEQTFINLMTWASLGLCPVGELHRARVQHSGECVSCLLGGVFPVTQQFCVQVKKSWEALAMHEDACSEVQAALLVIVTSQGWPGRPRRDAVPAKFNMKATCVSIDNFLKFKVDFKTRGEHMCVL